jgi:antitoxin (DNA-binding transcriptional repressor) of toxin-antitoxin stability system
MDNIIGLREFREDVQKIAEGVAKGNEYIVVKRSRPLFRIVRANTPVRQSANLDDWKKFAGILKGRGGPDPLKWQKKIRGEWETIK